MNNLTDRCKSLLIQLFNNDLVTLDYLEDKIKVSKRTLVKDLDIIEEVLKKYEIDLIRKPNKGIWISASKEKIVNFQKKMSINENSVPATSDERQTYILTKLFDSNGYITIQELADELYVSKGTLTNELLKITEFLKDNKINLEKKQNKGMLIRGQEKDVRAAYANIITNRKHIGYMLDIMDKTTILEKGDDIECLVNNRFQEMLNKDDVIKISNIIKEVEKELNYSFSDSAFTALIIHIVIAIKRIKEGKQIRTNEIFIERLKLYDEYQSALKIVKEIEKSFHIQIPEEEIGYITMHILGAKISKVKDKNVDNEKLVDAIVDKSLKEIIYSMIYRAEEVLQIRLVDNDELYKGLIIHVRPAINRLINNMPIKNPYLQEIKKRYPISFEAAVKAFDVLKDKYCIQSNEDEIAYIALHFEAALERVNLIKKNEVKVLVVCSTGMGTSQLISAKLNRIFSNIRILDILSAMDIHNNPLLSEADFIISSIPLFIKNKTVINVNPFLEQKDIDNIRNQIKISDTTNKIEEYKKFSDVYEKDLVFLDNEFDDKESLIKHACQRLANKKYVTENYFKSVLEREQISSTSYDGVAIPHGNHNEVIKSCIAIYRLKRPLRWGNFKVNVVFLIAINDSVKNYLKDIFNNLYEFLEDKERYNKLLQSKSENEIINILLNK